MIAAVARIAAAPAARRGALALAAAAATVVALSSGDLARIAARAALAAGAVFAIRTLVGRRRAGGMRRAEPIVVTARATLAPGVGVALVEAGGRHLLVSFGKEGARLIREVTVPPLQGGRP